MSFKISRKVVKGPYVRLTHGGNGAFAGLKLTEIELHGFKSLLKKSLNWPQLCVLYFFKG